MSLPVIVGTGLTGCAISRSLARAGVDHLLVGPAPGPRRPRLGESLNLEGSLDILAYFPEFADAYLAKSAVNAHIGDLQLRCDLNMDRGAASTLFYRVLGYPEPPKAFLHVDRKDLDERIFAAVCDDARCTWLDAFVQSVEYDRTGDRVVALALSDGQALVPSFVWDATNHVGAVARHLELEKELIGTPRRAVYGHYTVADEALPTGDPHLRHTTHLVRLDAVNDGLEALVWYIPLGEEISVGVVTAADEGSPAETLMERGVARLVARGLVPEGALVGPDQARKPMVYQHYEHDRAYGSNWLLAGGTFCLMAFGTSAGVSTGFAAATCAPGVLNDVERFAAPYEELLKNLRRPHGIFDWLENVDPASTSQQELEEKGGVLVAQSVRRLALTVQLTPKPVRSSVARFLQRAIEKDWFDPAGICVRVAAPGPRGALVEKRSATLATLLEAFAGQRSIEEGEAVLAPDVQVHMDGLSFRGRDGWSTWARHSHATWGFDALRFEQVGQRFDPVTDRLDVDLVAVITEGGVERRSPSATFGYRFEGEQVVEIWTRRSNYTALYGERFGTALGFAAHLAKMQLWARSQRRAAA